MIINLLLNIGLPYDLAFDLVAVGQFITVTVFVLGSYLIVDSILGGKETR